MNGNSNALGEHIDHKWLIYVLKGPVDKMSYLQNMASNTQDDELVHNHQKISLHVHVCYIKMSYIYRHYRSSSTKFTMLQQQFTQ